MTPGTYREHAGSRIDSELRLLGQNLDFSATYMTVRHLTEQIRSFPGSMTDQTARALESVLESTRFDTQKQVLFLFREAARALAALADNAPPGEGLPILPRLMDILEKSSHARHRAVAETLSSMPLGLRGPVNSPRPEDAFREIPFESLLALMEVREPDRLQWKGRSLAGPARNGRLAVVKFIRRDEDPFPVTLETGWMTYLADPGRDWGARCDIPVPVRIGATSLFKVTGCPGDLFRIPDLHPERFAIAFTAPEDYYRYPNGDPESRCIPGPELREMMERNAWLLGRSVSWGIVHTAPVPLFHNRVQQGRREDGGLYQWQRGGRLDRWLESCRHPNFAGSGLRDFEHFEPVRSLKDLGHHIGSHLLSLVLVTGSYFRNQEPGLKGSAPDGSPLDTRHLFDRSLFRDIIARAMNAYFRGFTGTEPREGLLAPSARLMDSLVDHMGVDLHMEEVLRIEDQNRMDPAAFRNFLTSRGFSAEDAAGRTKGESEITLRTGPHLGGFNQRISVPELIDYIFSCSALCISGRYIVENGLKQSGICDMSAVTAA